MTSTIRPGLILLGLAASVPAIADEEPLDIKSDLEGQYFVVSKDGTVEKPVLLVKRVATGYRHYLKREFDCAARTVRYLGEGESLKELAASEPEPEASPMRPGSISDQLSRLVCPED